MAEDVPHEETVEMEEGIRVMLAVLPRRLLGTITALLVVLLVSVPRAATIETVAKQAILVDMSTGTILFEKNARERMPTSSMSKMMTVYMVFEQLKSGNLSLDDTMTVSERAWRMGGSKTFVELGNQIRVEDLLRGVIVQSGNDACIVLAEGLAGSEAAFAEAMTRRARELGLTDSNFTNATGWPDPNHYSTAYDLALLAQRLITDFPEYYHYFAETEFTYHGIRQGNRNPLLYRNMGADGLKTGHTEEAGYGLAASAVRNGRRLVLVVNGLPDVQTRADESAKLIEWGFREFDSYRLLQAGEVVDQAPVWLGAQPTVPLVVERDVAVTLSRAERDAMTVTLVMEQPVAAPVAKGTPLGKLVVRAPSFAGLEVPVVAGADVERLGFFGRIGAAAHHIIFGGG